MTKIKLSVITINLNNRDGLALTIESVINQTFSEFEYIIIDGGSSDGSTEVIKKYSDRISYWISEPDNGIYNAMNKGVTAAKGEYCNFMNSGDCFHNQNVLKKVFQNGQLEDIIIGKAKTPQRIILPPSNPTFSYFYTRKSINHQAAFIKRTLLQKYPYDEINFKIVSDWKFFYDAIIVENCSYKPINDFIVRFDDSGIGSQDIEYNNLEQKTFINSVTYPRILEDYQNIQYFDSLLVKISICLTQCNKIYGKFLNPAKYYHNLKKLYCRFKE